jgi:RNA polymerase sigma-70 factor (ECF subfamily)
MQDDRSILEATRRGEDGPARELWRRYGGRLLAYAAAVVPGQAEDTVQRVFCRILELPAAEVAAVRDVPAWLVTLARREAITLRRREGREAARRARSARAGQAPAAGGDPDLAGAVAALPRPLREVVVLRHTAGLTIEQVAAALGANRNTVAWRYGRAVELLRALLSTRAGDGGGVGGQSGPTRREATHAAR